MLGGVTTVLQRSLVARSLLAMPFGAAGVLFLAAAPASALLTLPAGVLFTAIAVWAVTGAQDPPHRGIRWTMAVSGGLTAAMIAIVVVWGIIANG